MRPNCICYFPVVFHFLPSLDVREPVNVFLSRLAHLFIFQICHKLRYLRDENLFMVGVYLGRSEFYALELLFLSNWTLNYLIFIDVNYYIGFGFRIV